MRIIKCNVEPNMICAYILLKFHAMIYGIKVIYVYAQAYQS